MIDINWHPAKRDLRVFGITILVGFLLIGSIFLFIGSNSVAYWLWAVGIVLGLTGMTGMVIALPVYWLWMSVAWIMGNIMSRVILFVIYFFVCTPVSLIMRCTRRDRLRLRNSDPPTWWITVNYDIRKKEFYERQF